MPRNRLFTLFWLIFAAASAADLAWDGSGPRAQSASAQSPSLLLVRATLIDGTGAPPVENAWVRVDDGRIAAVGRGDAPPSRGARVLDLRGMTVVPGLSDMHVHVQNKARGAWALKMFVAHGVTNVREVGSALGELRAIQDWMQTDPAVPHLTTSGVILNGNGPQGLFLMPGPKLTAQMEADLAAGARFVKSHNEVSLAGAQAIAAFAKEHDTPWIGHVPFTMTSLTAIDLGLTSVEHMQVRPSEVVGDPEVVARYPIGTSSRLRDNYWAALDPGSPVLQATLAGWEKRRNRFFFDPTLVAQYNLAHGDVDPFLSQEEWDLATPLLQQQWSERGRTMPGSVNAAGWAETKVAFKKQLEFLRLAHARGVRLLTGTDFGAYREVPGVALLKELELMAESGLSPAEVIRASTSRAAESLRTPDRGTIAPGQVADLVVVRGNAAVDIRAMRQTEHVVIGGRLFSASGLMAEARRLSAADAAPSGAAVRRLH